MNSKEDGSVSGLKGVIESIFAPFSHEKIGPMSARAQPARSSWPICMAKSGSIARLTLKKYFSMCMRGSLGTIPVPEPQNYPANTYLRNLNNAAG